MSKTITRRDFLKLGGLSVASIGFNSLPWPIEEIEEPKPKIVARVTVSLIYVYQEPNFKSERIGTLKRDTLIQVHEEIQSPDGPKHNPIWVPFEGGYVHSGYLQKVEKQQYLNLPLKSVPRKGQLGEITVPYTTALRKIRTNDWVPLYRLYYSSVHWITSLEEGPNGNTWYELTDERLGVKYRIQAAHMRPIQRKELTPISSHVPEELKRLEVHIGNQTLTAYEDDEVVLHTTVSTGLPDAGNMTSDIPTDTPVGSFRLQVKVPSKHMGDGELTDDIEAYELVGVPWVAFFTGTGVAFHGTFWHNNFGRRMSHGCINMRNEEAKWLYRWSTPTARSTDWNRKGLGTRVKVIE